MPLTVTALVPSYGRPESLQRCLLGLLAGERVPDEIIVVLRDTDTPSHQAVAQIQSNLPNGPEQSPQQCLRVVIVTQPGQIAAMNAGLPHVTGAVVTFPDDDCVPRPDWLRRVMDYYEDPNIGGVGGRDVVHAEGMPEPPSVERVGLISWYGRIIGNHHCNVLGGPRRVMHLKGVNMSFRRELLPPFDSRIRGPHINDTDISLAVWRTGHPLIFDPEAKVDHYPAVRPDTPGGRDAHDPRLARLDAHDWMYMLLKHLPAGQRWIGACYVLLVGTRQRPGVLLGLCQPRRWRVMRAALVGALEGIGTAWRSRS